MTMEVGVLMLNFTYLSTVAGVSTCIIVVGPICYVVVSCSFDCRIVFQLIAQFNYVGSV